MSLQLVDSTAVFEKRAKELRITDEILKKMSAKVEGYLPPLNPACVSPRGLALAIFSFYEFSGPQGITSYGSFAFFGDYTPTSGTKALFDEEFTTPLLGSADHPLRPQLRHLHYEAPRDQGPQR